jgi:hypothetical protein
MIIKINRIKKINTKYLQQIVDSEDQRTDHGSDYGPVIDYIKEELWQRQLANSERQQRQFELEQHKAHLAQIDGKQCPKCLKIYPSEQIDANFYKVANSADRYRPRCKACHVKASRQNRANNKLPF